MPLHDQKEPRDNTEIEVYLMIKQKNKKEIKPTRWQKPKQKLQK